jgi:hypothetical protein
MRDEVGSKAPLRADLEGAREHLGKESVHPALVEKYVQARGLECRRVGDDECAAALRGLYVGATRTRDGQERRDKRGREY